MTLKELEERTGWPRPLLITMLDKGSLKVDAVDAEQFVRWCAYRQRRKADERPR